LPINIDVVSYATVTIEYIGKQHSVLTTVLVVVWVQTGSKW